MKRQINLKNTKNILYILGIIVLLVIIFNFSYYAIVTYLHINNGNNLVKHTKIFQQSKGNGPNILVLGDSLAYGVGTSSPEQSFAGQIGARYNESNIVNKARVGETTGSLLSSLDELANGSYEKVFLVIAGNDIAHYSINIADSQRNLELISAKLTLKTKKLYLYTPISFDKVGATPYFFDNFYVPRSEKIRSVALSMVKKFPNIKYIDTDQVSSKEYENYQASDGFHLNDKGVKALIAITFSNNND